METHKAALARYRRAPIHRAYRTRLAERRVEGPMNGTSDVAAAGRRYETMCPYCGHDSGALTGTFEVSGRDHVTGVALTRSGYQVPTAEGRKTDLQLVECSMCHASIEPLAYIAPAIFLTQRDGLAAPSPARGALALVGPDHPSADGEDLDDEVNDTRPDTPPRHEPPTEAMALGITYVPTASIDVDERLLPVRLDAELRDSIAQDGVTDPLTLCEQSDRPGRYVILKGGRRWSGAAGVQALVPAIIRRDLTDVTARMFYQLTSHHAKPLTPIEEGRAYARILDVTGLSVRRVAERAGVPRSIVSERVRLLDLGPWIPLIEDGTVPVAVATQHLLFLRRAPAAVHQDALDRMRQFPAWIHSGGALPSADFGRLVIKAYAPFVYPLARTDDGGPQPAFDTSDHAAACACDGVPWPDDSWNGMRCVCVNPSYWQPRLERARRGTATSPSADADPHPREVAPTAGAQLQSTAEQPADRPRDATLPAPDGDTGPARLDADEATLIGLLNLAILAAGATLVEEARTLGIALLRDSDDALGLLPSASDLANAVRALSPAHRAALVTAVARRARDGRIRALPGRVRLRASPLQLAG